MVRQRLSAMSMSKGNENPLSKRLVVAAPANLDVQLHVTEARRRGPVVDR